MFWHLNWFVEKYLLSHSLTLFDTLLHSLTLSCTLLHSLTLSHSLGLLVPYSLTPLPPCCLTLLLSLSFFLSFSNCACTFHSCTVHTCLPSLDHRLQRRIRKKEGPSGLVHLSPSVLHGEVTHETGDRGEATPRSLAAPTSGRLFRGEKAGLVCGARTNDTRASRQPALVESQVHKD